MHFVSNLPALYDFIKVGFENLGCQHPTADWLVAINWSIVEDASVN